MNSDIIGVFHRAAANYEQVGPAFFAQFGGELVERAGLGAGERVLDVGCGRGHCLFPAAEAVGDRGSVTGIDLAPGMVEATAREAAQRGLGQIDVRLGDASAPDFPPGSFDAVLAGLVIFFLPDPDAAVRAWAELLRPGGRLAMTTFAAQDPRYEQALRVLAGYADRKPGELRVERPAERLRTAESIRRLLTGFDQVTITEKVFRTHFTGPEQWWEWVGSHGGLAIIETIPPASVDEARTAAFAALGSPDALVMETAVRFSVAVRG